MTAARGPAALLALCVALAAGCTQRAPPRPPGSPGAPSGFTAILSSREVTLSWSAATSATGYHVYRATAESGPYLRLTEEPIGLTAYSDTALTPGASYWYEIAAVNGAVEGPRTPVRRSVTVPARLPGSGEAEPPRPGSGGEPPAQPGRCADGTAPPCKATAPCLGSELLAALGKDRLLVGFMGEDAVAARAPFDVRYQYLAGSLADPRQPCADDQWWGCWNMSKPGRFVKDFIAKAREHRLIPMFTYYVLLHASGAKEGAGEVVALRDRALMARYLEDWRFLLEQIGDATVLLHIEPDLWGYAQHASANPHAVRATVASANPVDCVGQEESVAGLGRCMIAMVRRYAKNAKVGLHASSWGTRVDVLGNRDASLDVAAESAKVARFLAECGATEADFVVVETSDRDAGFYQSKGHNPWWDPQNERLPHFHQAFTWGKTVAETLGKGVLWWQLPVGNMSQPNAPEHWKDNRVQYFFDHPDELARSHAIGMVFGAGTGGQTTPSTDGGYLVERVTKHAAAGGTRLCP